MGKFVVAKLEDKNEDKWEGVPDLWVTKDDDQCWWPNNDVQYKAENEVIFNGSSKGWYLRPVEDVYNADYYTLDDAEEKAAELNRKDLEDERYNELNTKLCTVESKLDSNYLTMFYKQEEMNQDFQEMKEILETLKNQADIYHGNKLSLAALLPIKDLENLQSFELRLMIEDAISQAFKELIAILTDDENLTESVSKILGTVFSNQFAAQCSWDGQSGIKIENFFILKKIRVILKNIDANYEGFERDVTLWLENKKKSTTTPN
ncbi:uncharacterized protein LOC103580086 [Microplitis demolitor]|uniref:uncharacterized protein LOC103580086 n=1 Tax=Microplitis demolitor TaxID=69319 RepID=UPI0004CD5943|nr:uncharacterized protein LOC103580086 [Microplitis demolitor]